jgi:WD40 repeat protein
MIEGVAVSPDGHRVVAVFKREVWVWTLDGQGAKRLDVNTPLNGYASVAFSPDSQYLAVGAETDVRVLNLDHPEAARIDLRTESIGVHALAFSSDAGRLASGHGFERVQVWDLNDRAAKPLGHLLRMPSVRGGASSSWPVALAFSADGRHLAAVAGIPSRVCVWELDQGGTNAMYLPERQRDLRVVGFSPDSRHLAAAGVGGIVKVWDLNHLQSKPLDLPGPGATVNLLSFCSDGSSIFLATGLWAHSARFDGSALTPLASKLLSGSIPPSSALISSPMAFRFLNRSAKQLQVAVLPTDFSIRLETVHFDGADTSLIGGAPLDLLAEWKERLALEINDDGVIVPTDPYPSSG